MPTSCVQHRRSTGMRALMWAVLFFPFIVTSHVAAAQWANASPASAVPRLHVALLSVPLWGHFKPLWAVAEELAYRGHTVSVVVEEASWCTTVLSHSRHPAPLLASNLSAAAYAATSNTTGTVDVFCVVVPRHPEVFSPETFQPMTREGTSVTMSFVRLFDDLLRHHELTLGTYIQVVQAIDAHQPLTTVLCDIVTYACASTARHLQLPVVHGFPFTTQLSVGLHPLLPAVGLGFPRHMSLVQRTTNFAFKLLSMVVAGRVVAKLNSVRAAHGVAPFRDAYDVAGMYAPLLAPTLWGLDVPQPLCPNVHPVGPLNTRDQRLPYRRSDLSDPLADFLDRCTQGVLYVNWGTLSAPTASLENTLLEGLLAVAPYCVVWKRRSPDAAARSPPADRFFVVPWLPSPMAVLRHPHTLAFVSHCGDASVLEAVEAGVPIIGFPLFADQADVCQRVVESGIGVQVTQTKTFLPADVRAAVATIAGSRSEMTHRLRELRTIADAYGGPSRAADIVEARHVSALLSRDPQLERCSDLDGALRLDCMLLVWGAALVLATAAWTALLRGVWRRWLQPTSLRTARPQKAHKQL